MHARIIVNYYLSRIKPISYNVLKPLEIMDLDKCYDAISLNQTPHNLKSIHCNRPIKWHIALKSILL